MVLHTESILSKLHHQIAHDEISFSIIKFGRQCSNNSTMCPRSTEVVSNQKTFQYLLALINMDTVKNPVMLEFAINRLPD